MVEYRKYDMKIRFRGKVLGGLPKNPEMIEGWIRSLIKKGRIASDEADNLRKEMKETVEETKEKSWTGFKQDNLGCPYMEERHVKGLLKESGKVMSIKGAYRQGIDRGIFVKQFEPKPVENFYFTRDGEIVSEPDGYIEEAKRVQGMRGPRSIITRRDYIERAEVEFQIWNIGKVTDKDLKAMLEHGQEIGFLADRGLGFGKFDILQFKKIQG